MPYLLGGKQRGGSKAEPTSTAGPSSNQHDARVCPSSGVIYRPEPAGGWFLPSASAQVCRLQLALGRDTHIVKSKTHMYAPIQAIIHDGYFNSLALDVSVTYSRICSSYISNGYFVFALFTEQVTIFRKRTVSRPHLNYNY